MKKENQTYSIGELIKTTTFGEMIKSNKIDVLIKHSTIFSFWSDIVGSKFAKYSHPYSIKGSKIYISTKSPVMTQELSIYKSKLIKKINSYSIPLGIEIKDMVFNYKNYSENKYNENQIEDKPIFIQLSDIEKQELDSAINEKIENNINKISFLDENQKKMLINKILLAQKAKIIQNKK